MPHNTSAVYALVGSRLHVHLAFLSNSLICNLFASLCSPPANVRRFSAQPEVTTTTSSTAFGDTNQPEPTAATLAPLPERIEALNYSLDLWERTEAAPQGWTNHLRCCLYSVIFNYDSRHLLLSLASELPVLLRLLDQVMRTMLCRLLLGALGRHPSLSASSLGRHSARIPAATAELGLFAFVEL